MDKENTKVLNQVWRRGATLIELLVLIGIVAILTVIAITTLRHVRSGQMNARDLNNLRLSGRDILVFAADHDDVMLTTGLPGDSWFDAAYGTTLPPSAVNAVYWGININWNRVLAKHLGQSFDHWQSVHGLRVVDFPTTPGASTYTPPEPGSPGYATGLSRFGYSRAFVTSPELWTDPPLDVNSTTISVFFQRVRTSQVRSPAGKGLMIHLDPPTSAGRHHTVFVDGSAAAVPVSQFRETVPRPMGNPLVQGAPVLDTKDGHDGADR
jgi:type II secretory pathway pseudopilin PulG